MTGEWEIRGVPRALTCDMWWFSDQTEEMATGSERKSSGSPGASGGTRWIGMAGLVLLADLLFWDHALGLSLAIFAAAIFAVAVLHNPGRDWQRPALLLAASAFPVIEYLQTLSLVFLLAGLVASIAWVNGCTETLGRRALQLLRDLPWRGTSDGLAFGVAVRKSASAQGYGRHASHWGLPLAGGLILTGLLIEANPILSEGLAQLLRFEIDGTVIARSLFWAGAALAIWPLIAPPKPLPVAQPWNLPRLPGPGAGSVVRGLVLFNAILGVQTGMDAVYLWGGATLPSGMNAAEYAHRGAYPLLATALLAGAFALVARPFAREDHRLRFLLLLWLAQNLALTVAALLRLDLYVGEFGLTYLRLYAAIWMGLVAAGLGLIGWQVFRDLPNRWLVIRSLGLGIGTLYAAAFVNFADIIATKNLSRDTFDASYVCALGPTAAAAIAAAEAPFPADQPYPFGWPRCDATGPRIDDWRDWGFRNWRVRRYLEEMPQPERS